MARRIRIILDDDSVLYDERVEEWRFDQDGNSAILETGARKPNPLVEKINSQLQQVAANKRTAAAETNGAKLKSIKAE